MAARFPPLRHPVSLAGAVIATASAVGFLALVIADLLGLFANPYAGLVIFVALPAAFVTGLLLIPAGAWLHRRALLRDPSASTELPVIDLRSPHTRRVLLAVTSLTVVNAVIVLIAAYGALHWMESPRFCGQVCHTPMQPQFTAWQNTTHSKIACVECHVGEGGKALVKSKLAGTRQLYHVALNSYPRPIPASAASDMRPAIETCGHCHQALIGHGDKTRFIREYADDEANTETVTELQMHVGGPGQPTAAGRAIHWHADPSLRIEYVTTDDDRQSIPMVRAIRADGQVTEYVVEGTTPETLAKGKTRVMDCIDCHNTAAHRISPTAEQAVDRAIAAGRVNRSLPFVRREAVRLLKAEYNDQTAGAAAIESGLKSFYSSHGSPIDQPALDQSIRNLQALYRANVFPAMKVTWGVYKDNLGHVTSDGCVRCHDDQHNSRDGKSISGDCSYCHEQK